MIVLAGDIGGTHTRLARARVDGQAVALERVARFDNRQHAGLEPILAEFLAVAGPMQLACLAVAGPTDGRTVSFTNLDWHLDAQAIADRFMFRQVRFINDFAAVGWGLNTLEAGHLAPLQAGTPAPHATRLALGAGTGLGVGICPWHDGMHVPIPSEGGHIGFAPVGREQERLLGYLQEQHGRVSVERILSGPGIVALYRFCLRQAGQVESGNPLLTAAEPPRAISAAGLKHTDVAAVHALSLFAAILGQTAGDLALVARAEGGVYLAGGIAPQLLAILASATFRDGFNDKGRFAHWTRQLPVSVVLDTDIGLKGAALAAGEHP